MVPVAVGARLPGRATVTVIARVACRPPGSLAVAVTVVEPAAIPRIVSVLPMTPAVATPVLADDPP